MVEPEIDLMDAQGKPQKLEVFDKSVNRPPETPVAVAPKVEAQKPIPKDSFSKRLFNFYDKQYKKLMIIPLAILLISIILIGLQVAATGTFINKDVTLKGGVTLTTTQGSGVDAVAIQNSLRSQFPTKDISVREISAAQNSGLIIVSDIDGTNKQELNSFISATEKTVGFKLTDQNYNVEVMGPSLGESFFKETLIALLVAFILMSIVVMIYFRMLIPSLIVILCVLSDLIVTLAVVNLVGIRVGTAGIAAFLMLVGYSVDTDVLLTTRVLKRKEGVVMDRVMSSVKTGLMMTATTISALIIGLIFSPSDVIRQIMWIVLIGLFADMLFTWIQNVGILRYYLERKSQ